jgi:two-component system KDP operon response regulator KdpE
VSDCAGQFQAPRSIPRISGRLPLHTSAAAQVLASWFWRMIKGLAKVIQRKLRRHGFRFETVPTPLAAREQVDLFRPDLLLLDLDTANPHGFDLISDVRACSAVPIIAISSQATERDAVAALERGADDFIAKPCGLDELLARIRVGLRHVAKPDGGTDPVMSVGELQLDVERRRVLRNGQLVHLTPTEYRLLHVYVGRLRRKLEPDPAHPRYLMTESGVGYRFAAAGK